MARLDLTPQDMPGKYPSLPVSANDLDFTWTTAGASFADGAGFTMTGREIVLVRNDNASAQTVTVESVADEKNRTGDITTYSVGAGEYAMFGPFPTAGWIQSDGKLHFAATASDVFFAVLRLPAGVQI